jgi:hypothetical protein
MSARRWMAGALSVLVVGAFVAGYWPQAERRAEVEAELAAAQAEVAAAEVDAALGRLLVRLRFVSDAVSARNYGQAQQLSSVFFEAVRAEALRAPTAETQAVLEDLLQRRDAVTAALAQADPAVLDTIHDLELVLRDAIVP